MSVTFNELTPTTGVQETHPEIQQITRDPSKSRLAAYQEGTFSWDSTGMLHRAQPYSESSARLMHRTSIAGEEAVA